MGRVTRVGRRWIVALVAVGVLASVFALRPRDHVDSPPPLASQPPAHAMASMPTSKPAPRDSAAKAPDSNTRLLDAYLFFLAAFESHRTRGR